jgi:beta-lactam-binding protein with PASTA domain
VPNVVGRSVPDALSALNGAGLRLIMLRAPVSDRSQAGMVVAQTPLPGKKAPKNAQVLVYMGAFQQ